MDCSWIVIFQWSASDWSEIILEHPGTLRPLSFVSTSVCGLENTLKDSRSLHLYFIQACFCVFMYVCMHMCAWPQCEESQSLCQVSQQHVHRQPNMPTVLKTVSVFKAYSCLPGSSCGISSQFSGLLVDPLACNIRSTVMWAFSFYFFDKAPEHWSFSHCYKYSQLCSA